MPVFTRPARFSARLLLCILFSAASTAPALAARALPAAPDTPSSTVSGTITDPAGARVPHARVVLSSPLAVVATTEADARGEYRFDRVAPGRYELRVVADGFGADPIAVVVTAGTNAVADLSLRVSAVVESVVVSAAQVELPLARAADSVSVIPETELRAEQVGTVADALRSVPGLTVSRNGGLGSVTSLFPRGGESDYMLVMVDGIKVNTFGGGYDFSTLSTSGVERVEVVRGPESALFGADAIGGVVAVVTKIGGSPRVEGSVEGGSFGTSRVTAGTFGSAGKLSWGVSGERTASAGYTGIAPATGEQVSNDDFTTTSGATTVGWRASGGADLRVSAHYTYGDRGSPGAFGSNPIGAYTAVDRVSRGVTRTKQFGGRWRQPFSAAGHAWRQTFTASVLDLTSDFTSTYGLSASTSRRLTARSQTDLDLTSSLGFTAGAEYEGERATSTYITADSAVPVPINRSIVGLFAEARYQPTRPLTLTAGVRAERIQRDKLASNPDPFAPRPAFGVDVLESVNPRVSAAYLLGAGRAASLGWTRVHAAAGTGIRPPDAFEIAFTDNPGLKPERSRSVEVGVDQALAREHLLLGATTFYNRYDDLIVAVGTALKDASQYLTDNISNARSKGVELSAALRAGRSLSARLSYTFLDTGVLAVDGLGTAPPPFDVGQPLLRRPRHSASLDVIYTRRAVTTFARVGSRSRTLDVEPTYGTYGGLFYNPGFTSVDAGASWRLAPGVELFGRIGNLLDRHYEETYGFPALSRNVMIGVRLAAGR
jgi:outer membrane cobalamin receptor